MCDRPQRERKQALFFAVPEGRQTGYTQGGAVDSAARAACLAQVAAQNTEPSTQAPALY